MNISGVGLLREADALGHTRDCLFLRIADLGAWRGKSYRAGRAVNVGFSQYEPMNAHLQRTSAFRPCC